MFRKATPADIAAIAAIYDDIHTEIEAGRAVIGWIREIYPTRKTAETAVALGDMFVLEEDGEIIAAARINQYQGPEYDDAVWSFDAPPDKTMVLHTLVVSPAKNGQGIGSRFVDFYENYALEQGCPYLRMDTNALNVRARALYARLGYREACIVPTEFNGIKGVNLLCLDKDLTK